MTITDAFQGLTARLEEANRAFVPAELNDLLTAAEPGQIGILLQPGIRDPYLANYVAAMVEQAAHIKGTWPPAWTSRVAPLPKPVFVIPWLSLRAHLLTESPVPFRRRNIFIDSSIGARV